VSHGCEADFGAQLDTVRPEGAAGELRTIVGDDAVRHAKAAHDPSEEFDRGLRGDGSNWLHFHPLGKFVDGDQQVLVATYCPRETTHDV
jgi:hypothetical protein